MSAVSPCFNFKLQQLKNWIVNAKQYNRPRGLLDPPHSTRMTTKSSVLGGLKYAIDGRKTERRKRGKTDG